MVIYQFVAELEDYKPKIWRRFQVNKTITLARLAYIVMTLFEMRGSHLLSIELERPSLTPSGQESKRMELIRRFGFPRINPDFEDDGIEDAAKVKLANVNLEAPSRLVVWYDFGDDWRVVVKLEKVIDEPGQSARDFPLVLEGKGFGILEDCGGIYGLMDLAQSFKNKDEIYRNYCAETGVNNLDLEKIDLEDMNFRLKKIPAIYAKIYEKHKFPTQREIDLIERKYREIK